MHSMRHPLSVLVGATLVLAGTLSAQGKQPMPNDYPQHSMDRPQPPVVTPGAALGDAPSDAVVLFGGKDLSEWVDDSGRPAPWTVDKGWFTVKPGTGDIHTRRAFGDVQLHVEWSAPTPATGEGQERGNSGVFLMREYEVQVLDSWHNVTYADGAASAIFGQYPPLVNAVRPPGEWNVYNIIFHAPRWNANGTLADSARMTVMVNGVLVQDNVTLTGPTAYQRRPPYTRQADRLPIELQDHQFPVRFRNVWVRELP
ncbi:MAG TPA: DUF1080 domain-containing protein [Gemmatimonadales bacterium]|nr:DUF1080 domain-containing protein [Gemmatimonadales bacterium]